MLVHDPEHRLGVLGVSLERPDPLGDLRRGRVAVARHDRGDRRGPCPALVRVVGEALRS